MLDHSSCRWDRYAPDPSEELSINYLRDLLPEIPEMSHPSTFCAGYQLGYEKRRAKVKFTRVSTNAAELISTSPMIELTE
jgi:hypothetical protein